MTNTQRLLTTLESRFDQRPAARRAQNGNGRGPEQPLALEVQPPTDGDDWPAWLLSLARAQRLVQHDSITGALSVTADGWQHQDSPFLEALLQSLNNLARRNRVLLLLVARDEIYQTVAWLDGGRLALDIQTGVAGSEVIGVDLVIAPPYDRLTPDEKRLASDVSLAARAFCQLSAWPWPRDVRDARELLMAMLAYAVTTA